MKKTSLTLVLTLALAHAAHDSCAQKAEPNTQADVAALVHDALAADKANGKLAELVVALGLRGSFTCDITVDEKGRTDTVFQVDSDLASTEHNTRVKDFLKAKRYEFKLPKGKRYKLRETISFP
jgi:hypothetical protein